MIRQRLVLQSSYSHQLPVYLYILLVCYRIRNRPLRFCRDRKFYARQNGVAFSQASAKGLFIQTRRSPLGNPQKT